MAVLQASHFWLLSTISSEAFADTVTATAPSSSRHRTNIDDEINELILIDPFMVMEYMD